MILNFSNKEVIISNKSIFLAGPTRRDSSYDKSWRKNAVSILSDLGYSGVVYIPEYPPDMPFLDSYIEKQTRWEWKALDNAGVIVFWVPRQMPDMPAFTTNIEFGRYITKKENQIVLGYPDDACKMAYMELLYKDITGRNSEKTLEATLQKAIDYLNNKN